MTAPAAAATAYPAIPTGGARIAAYALFSRLTASPFAAEPGPPADLSAVLLRLERGLPYPAGLGGLAEAGEALGPDDLAVFAREYSALFEVGSDGPLLCIREELARADGPKAKEEVVRFYDFFGYRLNDAQAWAPDHLSVELEFLHFLAFLEGGCGREVDRLSLALAQRDFLERHLLAWVPGQAEGVARAASSPYLRALFEALACFLAADFGWRWRTLAGEEQG